MRWAQLIITGWEKIKEEKQPSSLIIVYEKNKALLSLLISAFDIFPITGHAYSPGYSIFMKFVREGGVILTQTTQNTNSGLKQTEH